MARSLNRLRFLPRTAPSEAVKKSKSRKIPVFPPLEGSLEALGGVGTSRLGVSYPPMRELRRLFLNFSQLLTVAAQKVGHNCESPIGLNRFSGFVARQSFNPYSTHSIPVLS